MKYPMLISSLQVQKLPGRCNGYFAYDSLCSRSYVLSSRYFNYARHLDGKTDPYSIDPTLSCSEVDEMLKDLDSGNLLRYERTVFRTFFSRYVTLHKFMPPSTYTKCFARALNWLLMLMWLPAFILAVLNIGRCFHLCFNCSIFQLLVTLVPLTIISSILHETGHVCAAFSYGVPVFEIGVMHRFLFPGMYVLIDCDSSPNHYHRAQINAAGIEMNYLFAAACFILSRVIPCDRVWMSAVYVSLVLGISNALPIPGLDGCSTICEIKAAISKEKSSDWHSFDFKAWHSVDSKE